MDSCYVYSHGNNFSKHYYIIVGDTIIHVIESKPDSLIIKMWNDPKIDQNMKYW